MSNILSINDLVTMANDVPTIVVRTGANKASFSIVYHSCGKRLVCSKEMKQTLALAEELYILPVPEQNVLLVAGASFTPKASRGPLSKTDNRICYSNLLVKLLVDAFELDYTGKSSLSFNVLRYEELDGITIAVVDMMPLGNQVVKTEGQESDHDS